MALFTVETNMERIGCLHNSLHDRVHGVQVHPVPGAPDADGETDQMVQDANYRSNML